MLADRGACRRTLLWLVLAIALCPRLNADSCIPSTLYSTGFEGGSGLDGWATTVLFQGADPSDWQGVQACTARGGDAVFRFGGAACDANYTAGQVAAAEPNGGGGLQIPAGASAARLSFWHRWNFETGYDGATLGVAVDGGPIFYFAPPAAILSGASYGGKLQAQPGCPLNAYSGMVDVFTGSQGSFVQTVVDLDPVCNAATQGTGGCAGHTVRVGFIALTSCQGNDAGWFLDDVAVSACTPLSYHTVTPCRRIDTRGADGPALAAGAERTFTLAGGCGVPGTARSVAVNLAVTEPEAAGHLTAGPADQTLPPTSTINFSPGQTRANNAVLTLAGDGSGAVKVLNGSPGTVHLIVDVTGYFE